MKYKIFKDVYDNFVIIIILFISCGMPPKERALKTLKDGLQDKTSAVRVMAAKGLAEVGDEKGYEFLYETLKTGNRDEIVSALGALYELSERRFSPIFRTLSKSEEPLVRTEVYRLIATINDTACYKILIDGTKDRIAKVRRYAYQGLANFKNRMAIIPGLKDIDPLVRLSSARSLGLIGEIQARDLIRKEMDPKNPNVEVWAQAVIALAEIEDTSAITYIKELLTDTPWDLRIASAQALLMLNNTEGVEVLKNGLASPDPFIRVKASEAMKKFPIAEFYELLKKATKDEYINVSINAIEALKSYHKKETLEIFEKLLSAPNPLVKIAAATAYLKGL
uniref:HEAT repeat domain-containing protein n=1 Tax=candidate division WOR-3 bacterium TaxID=2052148 RepID=A0A7C4TAA5_UNCW3